MMPEVYIAINKNVFNALLNIIVILIIRYYNLVSNYEDFW